MLAVSWCQRWLLGVRSQSSPSDAHHVAGRDPSTLGMLEINTGSRHLILNNGLFWGFNCSSRGRQALGSNHPWRVRTSIRAENTPRCRCRNASRQVTNPRLSPRESVSLKSLCGDCPHGVQIGKLRSKEKSASIHCFSKFLSSTFSRLAPCPATGTSQCVWR